MRAARGLLLVAPVAVLVLAGCSSDDDPAAAPRTAAEQPADDPAAGGIAQADDDLRLEIDLGDGTPVRSWTLTCVGFVEGSHPEAQAACDHLAGLERPFAPIPEDAVCTQQYGGPETARVQGRWGGEPVDLEVTRRDGCRLAQWDSLVPLLPEPAA